MAEKSLEQLLREARETRNKARELRKEAESHQIFLKAVTICEVAGNEGSHRFYEIKANGLYINYQCEPVQISIHVNDKRGTLLYQATGASKDSVQAYKPQIGRWEETLDTLYQQSLDKQRSDELESRLKKNAEASRSKLEEAAALRERFGL